MERMLKTMILIIHFTYSYRFPFPFHLLSDNYFHFIFQYLWHSTYRFLSILLNLFGPKFCEKSLNCSLSVVCLFCFVYHSFCYFIWANCWLKSSQGLFSRLSHVYLFWNSFIFVSSLLVSQVYNSQTYSIRIKIFLKNL